ncbi:MAG: hypothetical protein GKS00_02090 [Alphaproteobacteria bacterium]|nr:hypothetical protein [Alphaproteobacteria bacterium]
MSQYHLIVNLDKREFLDPRELGEGLQACELISSAVGPAQALAALLLCSNGRGGGDLEERADADVLIGRWAGDRIAVVGGYAEDADLPGQSDPAASKIFEMCRQGDWRDIAALLRPLLAHELGVEFIPEEQRVRYLDGRVDRYTVWQVQRDPDAAYSVLDIGEAGS